MSSPPDIRKQSYLPAISAFSPWSSRSGTPKPGQAGSKELDGQSAAAPNIPQRSVDHAVSRNHRLSLKNYPKDCPPLNVQWYHAVDIPKRKPNPLKLGGDQGTSSDKAAQVPRKYVPFSAGDSREIEAAYQRLLSEEDGSEREKLLHESDQNSPADATPDRATKNRTMQELPDTGRIRVPVNEDYLFDVDVERRELMPAYWLGPIYDVCRGTWFFGDGKPCDENLATQLEEGYLKVKPWRLVASNHQRSASQPRSRPQSLRMEEKVDASKPASSPITPRSSMDDLRSARNEDSPAHVKVSSGETDVNLHKTFRLFGSYMNSVVTYQDANVAWIVDDDLLSKMSSTLYERFGSGGYYAGRRVVRGYVDNSKTTEAKDAKAPDSLFQSSPKRGPKNAQEESHTIEPESDLGGQEKREPPPPASETRRKTLERQMSSLVESGKKEDPAQQEEEVRRREEKEIQDDYKEQDGDQQGREIEHLLLVTHGIGQRLGLRLESVNFVHDVNTLRKSMKAVYNESTDLQALNGEVDKNFKNCRIQALPICWRHLLDFPRQSLKHNRKEHDLGDLDGADEEYPNLDDITIEGVPAVRNLITDLALDILLYQSPAYKGHITRIVLEECNRIYRLWKQRNPNFKGKVSLVGHSLGSAIMFDILCNQRIEKDARSATRHRSKEDKRLQLEFEVEDFYALGSPIGLFQMLKGRTIAARHTPNIKPAQTPFGPVDDPFLGPQSSNDASYIEITTSSPKCQRVFNIFHPTDPIAYRLEPLISPAMAALKPQLLPYTKKGIFTAPVGQGLTGIGARVGQSVSSLWSSFSTGIASSLVNRSLGISGEEASRLSNPLTQQPSRLAQSITAGGNAPSGGPTADNGAPLSASEAASSLQQQQQRQALKMPDLAAQSAIEKGDDGEHPPTLIDGDIETLYSGFQKRRLSGGGGGDQHQQPSADPAQLEEWRELEEQGRRLKREEGKVRALNANGRVDYSIQEGAFDISLLASIASHLSYWADEDVSHFLISQLLARHRVLKGSAAREREREAVAEA